MNDEKLVEIIEIKEVVFIAKIITANNNTLVYARHCKLSINKMVRQRL